METKPGSTPGLRTFEDFAPSFEWVGDEKIENLLIKLPGFNKEHIKVGIDGYRNITISGERPLEGNKWSRFREDFLIPENINIKEMLIKFENEALHLTMPKLITPADPQSQPTRVQSPPTPEHPPTKSKPDGAQHEPAQKARTGASPAPESTAVKPEKGKRSEPADAGEATASAGEKEPAAAAAAAAVAAAAAAAAEKVGSGGADAVHEVELDLTKPNPVLVNIAVAIMLLVALVMPLMYLTYKLKQILC